MSATRYPAGNGSGVGHYQMSATRYPAGNGSVGSTTTSAYRVIHADPAIVGSTAGKPPTVVVAASRPVKMDPTTDSWTKSSPTRNSPR